VGNNVQGNQPDVAWGHPMRREPWAATQAANQWNIWSPQQQNQFMQGMADWYQTGGGQGQFQQNAQQGWTPQQQANNINAANQWSMWTPQQQQQFLQGMADYYQTGAGQGTFQQDQQAAREYWAPFNEGLSNWYQQQPGLLKEHHEANYVAPQPQYPASVTQSRDTMTEWQKWQLDNRPMGATSALRRPEDVYLEEDRSIDAASNLPAPSRPEPPFMPVGPIYHPRDGVAGGDFGGFVKAPGRDTAIVNRPPSFTPAAPVQNPAAPEPVAPPAQEEAPEYEVPGWDMDQFMQGMAGWYQSQPGRLAEDRAAVEAAGGPGSPEDVYALLEDYYKQQANRQLSNNLTSPTGQLL
jgi:hypothetical protein